MASILIVDFGSQYTQLILRRVRETGVSATVVPVDRAGAMLEGAADAPRGVILSGSPASVSEVGAPRLPEGLLASDRPVLGICYGLQLLCASLGGRVAGGGAGEYGRATLTRVADDPLLEGIPRRTQVWMSHGDKVTELPEGFATLARTSTSPHAAVRHATRPIYGVQFHPEVHHTPTGARILENFARGVCGARADHTPAAFVEQAVGAIRRQVGGGRVVAALSGGVDSTVMAVLLARAIGDRFVGILVDNGLLRHGEAAEVATALGGLGIGLRVAQAQSRFLDGLEGVCDPEEKRRIVGRIFIEVFEAQARALGAQGGPIEFLAQGTLYPDRIESVAHRGPSATIKTHHNVGGLPERMALALVEPLADLFKDEVRTIGRALGIPAGLLGRHPFPGPGLAVRVLGPVTRERLATLRHADAIFVDELRRRRYYDRVWQAFAVLLPVRSVGVMGDGRTYEDVVALRAVTSVDGMTADASRLPAPLLSHVASRIANEVEGVNRVVYDISSKPPATIEWE